MSFIPHTPDDVSRMLEVIGVESTDELFDEIPAELMVSRLDGIPPALSEMEVGRLLSERAALEAGISILSERVHTNTTFPPPVWAMRRAASFIRPIPPYQAEASQGTLQVIYEYQSMMSALTGMEVANASLYDGASALAEACLMAVRTNHGSNSRRILVPRTVNPTYTQVAHAIAGNQD